MKTEKWDLYFLGMSQYVSTASKDPSTKTGAVIIGPDHEVLSTGFNGFPSSMPDTEALYADREEKYSRIVHCEVNALIYAARRLPEGSTLYTYPSSRIGLRSRKWTAWLLLIGRSRKMGFNVAILHRDIHRSRKSDKGIAWHI